MNKRTAKWNFPAHPRSRWGILWLAALLGWHIHAASTPEPTVFQLRNGDRLTGVVLSEDTNSVVVATEWNASVSLSVKAIARREPAPATTKNAVTLKLAAQPQKPPASGKSDDKFKGSTRLGLDYLSGRRNRHLYYGRVKLEYDHPYARDPQKHFRMTSDYTSDFGETDGRRSANRMDGGLKADFDIGQDIYIYNLVAGGYDEIRKVELRYELGPGIGYHLVRRPALKLDVEMGFNYQAQQRADSDDVHDFNWRLGERLTWKLAPRFTITENAEFSPRATHPENFDTRLEANLAYALTDSLSLNFSILDIYDTQPAKEVNHNEFQLRSSLGVAF